MVKFFTGIFVVFTKGYYLCGVKSNTPEMITKQELKIQLANDLFAIKMQLRKIGFILQCNEPTPEVKKQLDRLLDRKLTIERVLEELEKQR